MGIFFAKSGHSDSFMNLDWNSNLKNSEKFRTEIPLACGSLQNSIIHVHVCKVIFEYWGGLLLLRPGPSEAPWGLYNIVIWVILGKAIFRNQYFRLEIYANLHAPICTYKTYLRTVPHFEV